MKQIELTKSRSQENHKSLVKQLVEAKKNQEICKVFEKVEDETFEALLVPNSEKYANLFLSLEDYYVDELDYNLASQELTAQFGLSLMTVFISNGERKSLFIDRAGNTQFAMITEDIYNKLK